MPIYLAISTVVVIFVLFELSAKLHRQLDDEVSWLFLNAHLAAVRPR